MASAGAASFRTMKRSKSRPEATATAIPVAMAAKYGQLRSVLRSQATNPASTPTPPWAMLSTPVVRYTSTMPMAIRA